MVTKSRGEKEYVLKMAREHDVKFIRLWEAIGLTEQSERDTCLCCD